MKRRLVIILSACSLLLLLAVLAFALWTGGGPFQSAPGTPKGAMDAALRQYRRDEHPARGRRFEELTLRMERFRLSGGTLRESDVLELLGPPDLHYVDAYNRVYFRYFYDRDGQRDWTCEVFLHSPGGWVNQMGWNAATANDHSVMWPYPSSAPATGNDADQQ